MGSDGPDTPTEQHGPATDPTLGSDSAATETGIVHCATCQKDVVPDDGACPHCRRYLPGNQKQRKNPINVARRAALLADLTREFPPGDVIAKADLETLADAIAKRECTKAGSAEWQRLVNVIATTRERLHASPQANRPALSAFDVAGLSYEQVAVELEALARLAREHAREHARRVAGLPPAGDRPADRQPDDRPPDRPDAAPAGRSPALGGSDQNPHETDERVARPPARLIPERCPYGCGSLTRCAELKGTRLDVWRVFHGNDPEEIARRDRDATAVMMRQVGKPLPPYL
jgi:hypothetical protein